MSNRTYVCLDCRTSKRAKAAYGLITDFRCTSCSKPLSELSWERRMPIKDDDKGWKELQALVFKSQQEWTPRRTKIGTEKLQKTDRLLAATEKQRPTARSVEKVRKLRRQRKTIAKQYNLT